MNGDKTWFGESETLWPGQQMRLQVKKVLSEGKSEYQKYFVFESSSYGTVLVLDGVIQATERDEFSYQEMIVHIPLSVCSRPSRVLIIGGGDCLATREVLRDPRVESILLCDIDRKVTELSKEYFSNICVSEDPKLKIVHRDGFKLLEELKESVDVIIVDSSDPVGPASTLYDQNFLDLAFNALDKNHGVLCFQGECIWLHLDFIHDLMKKAGLRFPVVDYAYTTIPTYPSGQIGFVVAATNEFTDVRYPMNHLSLEQNANLRYYSPQLHRAAFVLPQFAERKIALARKVPSFWKTKRGMMMITKAAAGAGILLATLSLLCTKKCQAKSS